MQLELDPWDPPWRSGVPVEQTERAGEETAAPVSGGVVPRDFKAHLRQVERELLERALESNRYHQKRTAEALGLNYAQLRGYLKKHDLKP